MATKKELLEQSQKSLESFFKLCAYLLSEDAPLDVNEIPEDNPFFKDANEIAEDMGLDWKEMSHQDSNAVMLNLLSDYYANIKTVDKYLPVLSISFKKA